MSEFHAGSIEPGVGQRRGKGRLNERICLRHSTDRRILFSGSRQQTSQSEFQINDPAVIILRAMRAMRLLLLLSVATSLARILSADAALPGIAVTSLKKLSEVAGQNPSNSVIIQLSGTVLWSDTRGERLVLQDDSGMELLELKRAPSIQRGHMVQVAGEATVLKTRSGVRLGTPAAVVDNDGVHVVVEKSGSTYMRAGLQPFQLDWFNGLEGASLELDWAGPGFVREPLPADRFKSMSTNSNGTGLYPVAFELFEGPWEALPDFSALTPVATGTTTNLDVRLRSRREHAGIRFSGLLDVPADGVYTFWLKSDDGSRLQIGSPTVSLKITGEGTLPNPLRIKPGQPLDQTTWAMCEGIVAFASRQPSGISLELQSGSGRMRVELTDTPLTNLAGILNRQVTIIGVCQRTRAVDGQLVAGELLAGGVDALRVSDTSKPNAEVSASSQDLPILTSAAEVHGLKRDEAQRGYPVRLRGVVTSVLREHQAFTLQDTSRGIYIVDFSASRPIQPELGEFLEVDGITDPSLFAPVVNAVRVRTEGRGLPPEPVRPGWEQLVNGSLDAQYVEVQGIVSDVRTNRLTLRMQGGVVHVELRMAGGEESRLTAFENALVRIRGCLFASWDYVTHQVRPGEVRLYSASLAIDEPAPIDPFSVPVKTAEELRLFDPRAGAFQRVKVTGQLLLARGTTAFITGNGHGIRVLAREAVPHVPGDVVEAAGFPDVSGPAAPVLLEAFLRTSATKPLPPPVEIMSENLIRPELDATRVRVVGTLIDSRKLGDEWLFEMQSGVRTFSARIPDHPSAHALVTGSRLALTGVYVAHRGTRAGELAVSSFELLVGNAGDVTILARPPWWTLERLLMIVGALLAGLAATMLWITQLRRKVEHRTLALTAEIRERQRVEHKHALEEERSRIARDLHDELGSGITEIGMLAERSRSALAPEERRAAYLDQMTHRARELVTALDEIVWAMNPRHDSLASLISYFSLYADRFLSLAGIAWRSANVGNVPDQVVSSRVRHQLFLAFKEALNNVVRHANATEVSIGIQASGKNLELTLADNGRGLPELKTVPGMDGVENMRDRMQRLGGCLAVASSETGGTILTFSVPTL